LRSGLQALCVSAALVQVRRLAFFLGDGFCHFAEAIADHFERFMWFAIDLFAAGNFFGLESAVGVCGGTIDKAGGLG
jgi:hypothetical protein